MLINRVIADEIIKKLSEQKSKIIVIYGARQVGKTTLVKDILADNFSDQKILLIDGDNYKYSEI